jgi:hypothetical protein
MIQVRGAVQLNSGEQHSSLHVLPRDLHALPHQLPPNLRQRISQRTSRRAVISFFFLAVACLSTALSSAQSMSGNVSNNRSDNTDTDTIHGIVTNSVTHEPIARALVSSPDNRFAALTNSEGRFEFTLPKADSTPAGGSDSNAPVSAPIQSGISNRPYMLMARKPGFRAAVNSQAQNLQNEALNDFSLMLIPESLIVGAVTLPTAEPPDSIMLQVFRRQVQEGRARWVPVGGAQSRSDGQFRFADLPAGTYKLLTHELLDRDPLTMDPLTLPRSNDPRGQLFGYPPVYYQSAPDFGSAATIQLAAGQTQTVNLSLVKQSYYRVKVPVINAPDSGVNVSVYAHGRRGPGFSLGYNDTDHAIEGMLPDGTYTVEAFSVGSNGVTGLQTITIKGGPIDGPGMTFVSNASIAVNVKEEFTSADNAGSMTWSINGRNAVIKGPRRYLNVRLEPADDFGLGPQLSPRDPKRAGDDPLVIEGAPAGTYWVQVNSSRGYPASIRSGNLDLQHQPLVVGAGGTVSPIEITMRDDTAEISGTVEGVTPPAQGAVNASGASGDARGWTSYAPSGGQAGAHIYCIPLPDSSGQITQIWVSPDGSFVSQGLAPGAYRMLAFDREQYELEYRDPEAMRTYDSKGPVVRVVGGQKEHVQLQLISTSILAGVSENDQ